MLLSLSSSFKVCYVKLPDIQTPRLFEIPDKFFDWFYCRPEQKIADDFEVPGLFFLSGSFDPNRPLGSREKGAKNSREQKNFI